MPPLVGVCQPENQQISTCRRKHLRFFGGINAALCKTSSYLLDMDSQPKEMFSWLVKQTTDYARITEALKAQDKMERVIK